jgi:hypothetical protein
MSRQRCARALISNFDLLICIKTIHSSISSLLEKKRLDMSEKNNHNANGLNAEAQTAGMDRRQERRTGRTERRQERRGTKPTDNNRVTKMRCHVHCNATDRSSIEAPQILSGIMPAFIPMQAFCGLMPVGIGSTPATMCAIVSRLGVPRRRSNFLCAAVGLTSALLLVVAAVSSAPQQAGALPAYSQQTKLPCGRCHLNVSGRGYRNAFGAAFEANGHKLPVKKK